MSKAAPHNAVGLMNFFHDYINSLKYNKEKNINKDGYYFVVHL